MTDKIDSYIRGTISPGDYFILLTRAQVDSITVYGTLLSTKTKGFVAIGGLLDFTAFTPSPDEAVVGVFSHQIPTNSQLTGFNFSMVGHSTDLATFSVDTNPSNISLDVASDSTSVILSTSTSVDGISLSGYKPMMKSVIYAGIWYDFHDTHSNVASCNWFLEENTPTADGFSGPPDSSGSIDLRTTQFMAIPFNSAGYLSNNGKISTLTSATTYIRYVDSWIKDPTSANTDSQVDCDKVLTTTSTKNCIFTNGDLFGLNSKTQLVQGYNYCDVGKSCSSGCLGACSGGNECIYSMKNRYFACGIPPNDQKSGDEQNKTLNRAKLHRKIIMWVMVGVISLILIAIFFYFFHKKHPHHSIQMESSV